MRSRSKKPLLKLRKLKKKDIPSVYLVQGKLRGETRLSENLVLGLEQLNVVLGGFKTGSARVTKL